MYTEIVSTNDVSNNYHLSYLMGSDISQETLERIGAHIEGTSESRSYKLRLFSSTLPAYKRLVREKLKPGFWNEIVGQSEILFIFKHQDGQTEEITYSEENLPRIARLCSQFNGDPLEKTSKLLEYLADNDFYTEFIEQYYLD